MPERRALYLPLVALVDPMQWALRQIELDRERTCLFPEVLAQKRTRMRRSPLAFLRGSAPLFYEMLASVGDLRHGPEGTGPLVGDAHLENFGAFTAARRLPTGKRDVVFDLNDFDETCVGPFRWDVLRLATSWILAGRELGVDGVRLLELTRVLLESHARAAFDGETVPDRPQPIELVIEQAAKREKVRLLDDRTDRVDGRRRFRLGERYLPLLDRDRAALPDLLERYARGLSEEDRPRNDQLEIVDAAFRVAGTGSLGALRIAVLTRGKGGVDGGFLFDLKEHLPTSAKRAAPTLPSTTAEGVVTACRACLPDPPRQLGFSTSDAPEPKTFVVRRLTPQEDKLELDRLRKSELAPVAAFLGALLGRAHARGARASQGSKSVRWSAPDLDFVLERAVVAAGLHEAIWLSYCLRTKD